MTTTDFDRWSADHIRVAAGTGILARRDSALLFVPEPGPAWDDLVEVFVATDTAAVVEAVTDAATTGIDLDPFVLVTWADEIHIVVLGAVEVHTDHASLPMLSGASSGSWVERRLRLGPASVTIHAGAPASPSTDLQLGRVASSGFSATFSATAPRTHSRPPLDEVPPGPSPSTPPPSTPSPSTPSPSAPSPSTPSPSAPPPSTSVATATPAPSSNPTAAPAADPTGPLPTDRLAALRAAMRGPVAAEPPAPDTAEPSVPGPGDPPPPVVADTASVDDEVTLAPEAPPADRGPADVDGDQAPFVAARRCGRGHLNPPHVGACRTCGDLLDAGASTEQVRQPPLAILDLDGESLPIDRALVLGRRPDADAAQTTARARLVLLADDASVSRTHLRIDVEDWTLTVTDCGSRSGTAIVARPGEEPRILEPWLPHELPIGARLFLGGPTSVVIRPAGDR